ncbi:MAG: DNA alkylation repair protein [Vicinamibacteria bacterium]|nr:DNA alkylation repair protein [Vicinamibacteria bacterium]
MTIEVTEWDRREERSTRHTALGRGAGPVGAHVERNFVKKGVSWALRAVGRRNPVLNAAAVAVASRLAAAPQAAPRWVGKDAVRELTSAAVIRRLAVPRRAVIPRS